MLRLEESATAPKTGAMPATGTPIAWGMAVAGVVLLVFGAKIALIAHYASVTPFFDQWDAEAAALYAPYLRGELTLGSFFASHNEHRIVVTRLLALLLLELVGEWRPICQMIVNAALHAAFAGYLTAIAGKLLGPRDRIVLAVAVALVFALPVGWENTLAAFQSQFYTLLIFSALGLALLAHASAFSGAWAAGIVACVMAYFSMASGALAILAAGAIAAAQLFLGVRKGPREIASVAIMIALGVLMIAWIVHIPTHDVHKAQSVGHFLRSLIAAASWPLPAWIGVAIVQAPLALLAVHCLRARPSLRDPCWPVLALAVLCGLQIASLAYGRGAAAASVSRYLDLVLIAIPLNFAALVFMLRKTSEASVLRTIAIGCAALWIVAVSLGLARNTSVHALPQAADRGRHTALQTQHLSAYLRGDATVLRDKPWLHIPYPTAERLEQVLADPQVRAILPRELRLAPEDGADIRARLALRARFSNFFRRLENSIEKRTSLFLVLGLSAFFLAWLLVGTNVRWIALRRRR
jgi:hypothetical protein